MKKIILGTIKCYRDGRLVGIRPYWVYELKEYKTPFLDFLMRSRINYDIFKNPSVSNIS